MPNFKAWIEENPELYYAKFTPGVHESVLNKLTYDTELESIYLIGNFCVEMKGDFRYGERRCIHGGRTFSLIKPVCHVDIRDITHQGFWFFTGRMTLTQKVLVQIHADQRYLLSLRHLNAPGAKLLVNE